MSGGRNENHPAGGDAKALTALSGECVLDKPLPGTSGTTGTKTQARTGRAVTMAESGAGGVSPRSSEAVCTYGDSKTMIGGE